MLLLNLSLKDLNMDYDFEAFAQKRIANNKTTTSTASANQQASQSMRSVGARGLGSPSFSTNTSNQDDDDNDTGGVKGFMDTVFSWFNASGAPDPKMPPSYDGSSVYDRDEFKPISYDPTTNRTTIRGVNTGVDMRSSDEIMADIDAMLDRSDDTSYKNVYESTYDEVPESLKGVEDFKARKAMTSGINTAIKGIMDTEQRQSKAMKDAINRTIQSVMSDSPDVPYVIQAGDTLSEIAVKTGTTVKELQELNNIEKANEIYTGNELIIPSNKSTKTKEDIVSSLIKGYERDKGDIGGTQVASSGEIMSDAITENAETSLRPLMRPTDSSALPEGEYYTADHMSDLEILARTIQAEAGGESKKGKLAVGAVIQNRVNKQSWMGKDIKSVILKEGQFSPWNSYTNYAGGEQGKEMLSAKRKPSKAAYEAAAKILSGDYVDPTGGATHFVNPKVGSKPDWYKKFKDNGVDKIGQHEFGSPDDPFWQGSAFSGDAKSVRPPLRPENL